MMISKPEEGRMVAAQPETNRMVVQILRETETLCALFSDSTRLPFVECNSETFDDEILVFESKQEANSAAEALAAEGYPVRVMELPLKQRLPFFTSLFSMGVNAILLNKGTDRQYLQELRTVITRPEVPRFSEGIGKALKRGEKMKFRIENPEFHLTAIYFTQKARSTQGERYAEELKELQEEMMIHYREGYYLVVRGEDGSTPLLKIKDSGKLQPIFTDMQEFVKFQHTNAGKKWKTSVVTETEFLKHIAKEAAGIVVNPIGISLVLRMNRK